MYVCSQYFIHPYLFEFWFKVELLLRPDDALPEVLEAGAALLGGAAQVDHVVQVRLALHRLGNVLVKLLNNLEISKSAINNKHCIFIGGLPSLFVAPTCAAPQETPPHQGVHSCPPPWACGSARRRPARPAPGTPRSCPWWCGPSPSTHRRVGEHRVDNGGSSLGRYPPDS